MSLLQLPSPHPPKKQRSKLDDMTPFTGICFIIGKVSSSIHNLQVDICFEPIYTTKYTLWAHAFVEITLITASMLAEQFPASTFATRANNVLFHTLLSFGASPAAARWSWHHFPRLHECSAGCSWSQAAASDTRAIASSGGILHSMSRFCPNTRSLRAARTASYGTRRTRVGMFGTSVRSCGTDRQGHGCARAARMRSGERGFSSRLRLL